MENLSGALSEFNITTIKQNENVKKTNYCLFPIKHVDRWTLYKQACASFWRPEEIDLQSDKNDWNNKLNQDEKRYLLYVLAFFASADGIVNENLIENFCANAEDNESKCFYGFQIAMENIHSEVYSILIDAFITDEEQRETIFNAIETIPIIKKKAEWTLKWNKTDATYAEKLVAYICTEGIFFSSSFASIFWLKEKNLMKGLTFSNELISRDEGMHTNFGCLLYNELPSSEKDPDRTLEIIKEAVEIEKEFNRDALEVSLIGLNADLMGTYNEFVADKILLTLNLPKYYNVTNPLDFMENISLEGKTNFFDRKVSEYQKGNANIDFSIVNEF